MKRCSECGREYDNTMMFCLDDGAELLYGPASMDEPQTAIFSVRPESAGGSSQRPDETDVKTAILHPPATVPTGRHSDSKRRVAKPLLAVLAILAIAGIGIALYKFAGSKDTGSAPSFESMKITKLTDTGKAGSAAISPDGKYVVHVKEDGDQQSLWVVHIATGSNVQRGCAN